MKARVSTLLLLAAVAGGGMLPLAQAQAGVFDDDEARKAVINLRDQFNAFQATATQRIEQNSRTTLDMQNQLEGLRQEVARLRGQNEVLQNTVDTLQKQQKDYYADLDGRLKKFEPQQVTVEGREGGLHPIDVRLDAGEKLEGAHRLEHGHAFPRHGAATKAPGMSKQFGFKRKIDDVDDPVARLDEMERDRRAR